MNWNVLLKVLADEASESEKVQWQRWMQADERHRQLYQSLQAKHRRNTAPLPQTLVEDEWQKLAGRLQASPADEVPPSFRIPRWVWQWAACLTILAGLSLWVTWWIRSTQSPFVTAAVYATGTEGKKQITLPDGSVVWLSYNSKLVVDKRFNDDNRRLQLQGEAFFEVSRNPEKPFIVHADSLDVTVLGTSFQVYNRRQDPISEVTVATGLVRVKGSGFEQLLQPNQRITVEKQTGNPILSTVLAEKTDFLKTGLLHFQGNNLPEIARKLSRHYGLPVVVQPGNYRPVSFTGTIKDTGLTPVLEGICFAAHLQYKREGPTLVLFPK